MSDEQLLAMLVENPEDFTPEARKVATAEVNRRGGIDSIANKIERERHHQEQQVQEREAERLRRKEHQREKERERYRDIARKRGGDPQSVVVTDIHMKFESMVFFMVKWVIASIPAFIILAMLLGILWALFSGINNSFVLD